MNTIPSESDSNAILDRLLSGAGLHRDAQLAALLGVSPQAVSQARRKRKIPEGWVVKVSQQCGLSMDWLMFGKGDESTPVASHAPVASSTSQASTPAGAAVPDLDLLCIPLVAASLSAGVGSLQTEADVLDYFAFRSDWLCRKGNPDKMVLMKVYGDSMEPEICQLCGFLNNMGAVICGAGTKTLMIQGVRSLKDSAFRVEGDRIVAGTYGAAVMAAGGDVTLKGVRPSALKLPLALIARSGGTVTVSESSGRLQATGIGSEEEGRIRIRNEGPAGPLTLKTGPYPEFPTDLQSPFMAFLAAGRGVSRIEERVFEGRFGTAGELEKMGALIRLEGKTAVIYGAGSLKGSAVKAADLRGGAALAVAALTAKGETVIGDCRHIERGYEDICRDLSALGARIQWIGE